MFNKYSLAAALALAAVTPGFAEGVNHRVAFHVDENNPALMNLTLNNVANVSAYYQSIGDTVEIEVVAYGPGLHMLREDTSPVADRIAAMSLEIDSLTFAACGNTHRKMEQQSGTTVALLDEAEMVPAGVVELISLQEEGWSYIRP